MKTKQKLPGLFGNDKVVNLKRFVAAKDLSYRTGYLRMNKGKSFESFYWYDEIWCVLEGEGRVRSLRGGSPEARAWKLKGKDLFFISRGERIWVTGSPREPLLFFYCAIPASSKDLPWLAHMTKQDIDDVKKRFKP